MESQRKILVLEDSELQAKRLVDLLKDDELFSHRRRERGGGP